MKSVRMLAAGAVALFALPVLTAPVRACDDRYIKKCEAEAEAAFLAESQTPAAAPARRRPMRMHPAHPAAAKRLVPSVVTRPAAPSSDEAPAPQVAPAAFADERAAESPIMRRFRGFIDPQPMTVNAFEELRRPRLDPRHLDATPAMAGSDPSAAATSDDVAVAEAATAVEPPKAEAAAPPPAIAQPVAVADGRAPVPVVAQTAEVSDQPTGFPFHKLVLTICAALGVASALRFIVRA